MIVTELTRRALKIRREARELEAQGYRRHETDWEIHRGVRIGERIVDARVSCCGLYVWTRLGRSEDDRVRVDEPRLTRDQIAEHDEELLLLEPAYFDNAILGIAERPGLNAVLYSSELCVRLLAEHEGMTLEEAGEFFDFNTRGAYMGPTSPLFI